MTDVPKQEGSRWWALVATPTAGPIRTFPHVTLRPIRIRDDFSSNIRLVLLMRKNRAVPIGQVQTFVRTPRLSTVCLLSLFGAMLASPPDRL